MPRTLPTDGELCDSCKREATVFCGQRTKRGLRSRVCMVPLCDECTHYDDKRWPIHDRSMSDRSGNQWIAERQAEELLAEGDLLGVDTEVLSVAQDALGRLKPVSARQRRKQRDDLVELLEELRPEQTIVPDGMSDTLRPGDPHA